MVRQRFSRGECSQYGAVESNGTSKFVSGTPHVGLCVVLTTASIGPKLLVNLSWIEDRVGIWFKTSA